MKTTRTTTRRLIAVAVLALGTAAAPAFAGDARTRVASEQRSVTVGYADLDLSHPAGLEALRHRVAAAARTVCGTSADSRELRRARAARSCYETAVGDALRQVGVATLAMN